MVQTTESTLYPMLDADVPTPTHTYTEKSTHTHTRRFSSVSTCSQSNTSDRSDIHTHTHPLTHTRTHTYAHTHITHLDDDTLLCVYDFLLPHEIISLACVCVTFLHNTNRVGGKSVKSFIEQSFMFDDKPHIPTRRCMYLTCPYIQKFISMAELDISGVWNVAGRLNNGKKYTYQMMFQQKRNDKSQHKTKKIIQGEIVPDGHTNQHNQMKVHGELDGGVLLLHETLARSNNTLHVVGEVFNIVSAKVQLTGMHMSGIWLQQQRVHNTYQVLASGSFTAQRAI